MQLLKARAALYLQASMLVCFLAGSSAPTRLDSFFAVENGAPAEFQSAFAGFYAVAALLSLLISGSLSDYIGRRPVLVGAALLQAIAIWLLSRVKETQLDELVVFVARLMQGVATGGALSALGAGMLDVDRASGTPANVIAWMLGLATAGLIDSLLRLVPDATPLVYAVFGAVFVMQAMSVMLMPEPLTVRAGALAWLRPSIRLPRPIRRPVLLATASFAASWAMLGFWCSNGRGSLGLFEFASMVEAGRGEAIFYPHYSLPPSTPLALLRALTLFAFGSSAALAVFVMLKRAGSELTRVGMVLLLVGCGLTMLAIRNNSVPLLFLACMLAGAGTGTSFQAALRSVMPLVSPSQYAAVLSVLYLVGCLATVLLAVPVTKLWLYDGEGYPSFEYYLLGVAGLAAVALVGALRWPAAELT